MAVDFGPVAKPYALLEKAVFGGALQSARTAHLDLLSKPGTPKFLLTGEGDGRFVEAMTESHPASEITVVDSSPRMLDRTRRRLGKFPTLSKVRLIRSDILADGIHSNTPPQYDAVISHFFLDCFSESEIATIAEMIVSRLVPGGHWIVTDFQKARSSDRRGRRIYRTLLLRAMYRFFRLTANLHTQQFPNYAPIISLAGFRSVAQTEFLNGFVKSTAYQLASPDRNLKSMDALPDLGPIVHP